mgnify:CR=1 FL=1|tara:strand:- start:12892 stop:14121 length:1230 start_codon:yes stop_codon:yes gene_type:complete
MKILNKYSIAIIRILCISALFFISIIFTSCNNDDSVSEAPYFTIEENPTGLTVGVNGDTKSYVVRSNRPWKIVEQGEADWVKAFPAEGEDDGIFEINVQENITFDARTVNYAFVVDGKEQPTLFRVDQEANVPFINVDDVSDGITVPSIGGNFSINVNANVVWTYTIDNDSWLTQETMSDNEIILTAAKNRGDERSVTLTVKSSQYPNLNKQIIITQSPGNIILEENFDWLAYGSTIFYTTGGETRMDSWTSEELDRGWTSTENTFTSNQKVVYARTGFLKLGKTGYGGDLISRPLSSLDETTTVRVTFKAVPYKTKGGTQDDNTLKVGVVGPGSTNINSLTIDNWPDYDTDPECTAIWESDTANYEFTVTGATSETQIRFLGGDFDLRGIGKGKNRIFLDDIKVEIIE